mmetsp:Transcript_46206/g.108242  ORF Transcript_46206/g.108242 Transcript_46206/m.108242 type:complete len:210 (-) Transcript_46206:422-1051(-)
MPPAESVCAPASELSPAGPAASEAEAAVMSLEAAGSDETSSAGSGEASSGGSGAALTAVSDEASTAGSLPAPELSDGVLTATGPAAAAAAVARPCNADDALSKGSSSAVEGTNFCNSLGGDVTTLRMLFAAAMAGGITLGIAATTACVASCTWSFVGSVSDVSDVSDPRSMARLPSGTCACWTTSAPGRVGGWTTRASVPGAASKLLTP